MSAPLRYLANPKSAKRRREKKGEREGRVEQYCRRRKRKKRK